ncbi:uncharacterized protein LOC119073940 [Bradysia coprophila]|uniref:uncharacterized protein LOC119073940 n=1 Tax=Bradysia coprophila TaxID=38358 RepID=UPI00187D897D|nr:uncharacterized protein LOC119073940 [Bradysia coprophila]
MNSESVDSYDVFWWVNLFSKVCGYCPQTYKRSIKVYDLSGTIIAIILLILKMALFWANIDSRQFSNITNSTMMNYGIWLQLVAILLISIVFTVIGLRKYEHKWTLLENYNEIDDEFVGVFHAKLFKAEMKKSIFHLMMFSGIGLIAILCLTFYLLSALAVDIMSISHIGLSVFIANLSILSVENQLNSNQIFVLSRYSVINNILLQLLYDSAEMKHRNVIVGDDMLRQKEFQYTKYRNNFQPKNILLRDQLEINTITKSEVLRQKRVDLSNQKKKLEESHKKSSSKSWFSTPMILIDKKSQVLLLFHIPETITL